VITIDGSTGEVFEGAIAGSTSEVPEAATLGAWAEELGISLGHVTEPDRDEPPISRSVTPDACLRALAIKGVAPLEALADAVVASSDDVRGIVDQLLQDDLVGTTAGAYTLTNSGKTRASELVEAERDAWGSDAASAALDRFLELDQRMKETVTAWQMRDAETINDHSDPDYDGKILDRLAALSEDAMAWVASNEAGCPRLGDYRLRLERALDRAREGDHRYVASPRVDSYHSVWFELHEDLIQLAGRTRAEEVALGRA
jgi:pyruvate,orthophosphate dikinase